MLVRAVWGNFIGKTLTKIQEQIFYTISIKYRYLIEKRHLRDKHHGDALARPIADE